jgi:mercuric ion transport protein
MATLRIDLIYDQTCPNVDRARSMIRRALFEIGAPQTWIEWDRDDEKTPLAFRRFGSPTVLVNGRDVGCEENDDAGGDGNSCRVYTDDCGCFCGAPSAELIVAIIRGVQAA